MSKSKEDKLESFKSNYHFAAMNHPIVSPVAGIYYKGAYHFYYLSKSADPSGTITWGMTQSTDLIHWTDGDSGWPISDADRTAGCIVIDSKNSSGLGSSSKPPLISIYGENNVTNNSLSISYSLDGGKHWLPYDHNPVLDLKKTRFRDPYIFWHAEVNRWIMVVSVMHEFKIQLYTSKNLIKWEFSSDFGGHPSFKKEWSHVSLFELPVVNQKEVKKWILLVTTYGEYSSVRYFVGIFNGKAFMCDHALDQVNPLDHGKDLYAPRLIGNGPDHRLIIIGALTNKAYHDHVPAPNWLPTLSIPRELSLMKETDGSYAIIQNPVGELKKMRTSSKVFAKSPMTTELNWELELSDAMEFELVLDSHKVCTIEFDYGSKAKLLLQWDPVKHVFCLDRTSKPLIFHANYPSIDCTRTNTGHLLPLHIFLDKNSIEIFVDHGKSSLSSIFIAPHPLHRFRILGKHFAAEGTVHSLTG